MTILHVVGARPNFMKLAPVHAALAQRGVSQVVVHTGQHYDAAMSEIFFRELELPEPGYNLNVGSGSHAQQTAEVMKRLEPVVSEIRPEWVLVYGDVNSTMAAALVCSKLLIKVAHVEAGLRSFDRTMPEEINRVVTDRIADLLFTPSEDGDANLVAEGVPAERIRFVGNVMADTLLRLRPFADAHWPAMQERFALDRFALVTLHRPSNVDEVERLLPIVQTLAELSRELPVVFPIHPRTRESLSRLRFVPPGRFLLTDPLGYLDFIALQSRTVVVITDSGGVQEETTVLGIPCLTMRENTERPVTVTLGSNTLVGTNPEALRRELERVRSGQAKKSTLPPLWDGKAGERIADVLVRA